MIAWLLRRYALHSSGLVPLQINFIIIRTQHDWINSTKAENTGDKALKPESQYVDRPPQMRLFNEVGSRSLTVSPVIRRASKQSGWWRLSMRSVSSNGISQTRQIEAMEFI